MVGKQGLKVAPVFLGSTGSSTLAHGRRTGILGVKVALVRLTLQNLPGSRYLYALEERFLVFRFFHYR
jgi:hypothetical protein